jgi:hypothetical protein
MAKMNRERLVKERRALKQEKKQAAAAERSAKAADTTLSDETGEDEHEGAAAPSPASPERSSQASPN